MPKCYLMIEDVDDGTDAGQVQFAMDIGSPLAEDGTQELPATVEDMSPAQEATWKFYNVLMGMFNPKHKAAVKKETEGQILIPDGAILTPGNGRVH